MNGLEQLIAAKLVEVTDYSESTVEPAEGTMALRSTKVTVTHPSLDEPVELTLCGNVYGAIVSLACTDRPYHHLTLLDEDVGSQILHQIRESEDGKRIASRYDEGLMDGRAGVLLRTSIEAYFADHKHSSLTATEIRESVGRLLSRDIPTELKLEEEMMLDFGPCIVKIPAAV